MNNKATGNYKKVRLKVLGKRIKNMLSVSQALKKKVIYVYCPEEKSEEVLSIINNYDFEIVLNDYDISDYSNKVICHYRSASLGLDEKNFLIKVTEFGAWVEPLVDYLDARLKYTEVSLLQSSYFLHQRAFTILSTRRTQIAKRIADIVFSLILLLITLPIALLAAVMIKLESKGPLFYKQMRVGQYNKEFKVIKFRSMTTDAEKDGAKWAVKNDARVTKVGNFIRKTRIDELPQLINVLKGEMALVGPRPEREIFINELEKEIPYYRFRHAVKPGITGLAQVSYPYGASIEDAVWKHKYDLYYIKYHSTLLDLKILLKTVKTVIFGMGR